MWRWLATDKPTKAAPEKDAVKHESLYRDNEENKKEELVEALKQFFNEHYSADRMKLVVLAKGDDN